MIDPWPAPSADGPVDATVRLPGSKSVTNRGLLLAALADSPGRLRRPLRARDTEAMAQALRLLGVGISDDAGDWVIAPAPLRGPARLDCGQAGTAARFLPPAAALATGDVVVDGTAQLRARPLGPVLTALRALGAEIDGDGLPLTVHGRGSLPGGSVEIDASGSSQFVSGLLLAAPRFDKGVELRHRGAPLPSLPHVAMSVELLRAAGAVVEDDTPALWRVAPGPLRGRDLVVEPDLSNAAPFLAAALVTGGRVTVADWPRHTMQAGAALVPLLSRMGARCTLGPDGLLLEGVNGPHGIDADLHDVGELTPVLAAVAAVADSPSTLRGIAHLRGHETDRLAALARELSRLGADVEERADGLTIRPRPLHGSVFATYDDHRLATAAAVLGLVVPGVRVENVATTAKTLPGFVELWRALLADGRGGQP